MKYIVEPGCDLWNKLVELKIKMMEAQKQAHALCKELGFDKYRQGNHCLVGGITTFWSPKPPPVSEYIYKNKNVDEWFLPKRIVNKKILARIEALPRVEYQDLNKLIKYNYMNHMVGNRILFSPGIDFKEGYVLLSFDEDQIKYKPVKGMREILHSEFLRLAKSKKSKK